MSVIRNIAAALNDYFRGIGGYRPLIERIRYRLSRRDETCEQIIARILCE